MLQPRNAGNTILLGAFSGAGTLAGAQSNSGAGDTLYVIGDNDSDATFNGVISSNSAVAGSEVGVTKDGSGTLTLAGNSTYTGGTTVTAGTLRVLNSLGSATGSGDLEISGGATLTGNGRIGGATTIDDGATLIPGNPAGALTFNGNLALNDNSILRFVLGGSSASVQVNGNLVLTGQLQITNAAGFGPGIYPLFTCTGSIDFGDLAIASAPGGYNYHFDTNTTGVVKLVVAQPMPPMITAPGFSQGGFVFSGSGGTPGATYYIATTTNLATPPANWRRISTNQFDDNGNFSVTNASATNAQGFYRLELP
jgi:fibronectin-binding autotransporter adhesin